MTAALLAPTRQALHLTLNDLWVATFQTHLVARSFESRALAGEAATATRVLRLAEVTTRLAEGRCALEAGRRSLVCTPVAARRFAEMSDLGDFEWYLGSLIEECVTIAERILGNAEQMLTRRESVATAKCLAALQAARLLLMGRRP
ncbi:MAG: hypothetical protein ACOYEV_06180 [Candidatus Nanopelagicales bacterium]